MTTPLKDKAAQRYHEAREKAEAALGKSRETADEALRIARRSADTAAASARKAAATTGAQIDNNPMLALAGGLALGAIIAALLPHSRREAKVIATPAKKLRETAKQAAQNAAEIGRQQLDNLGVNAAAARDQVRDLAGKLGEAASSASSAALDTFRK